MNIATVVMQTANLYDAGKLIYETTLNAMDAAQKERDSGANKKAWVLAFVKSFIHDIKEDWEIWAKIITTFIDFAKAIYNQKRYEKALT